MEARFPGCATEQVLQERKHILDVARHRRKPPFMHDLEVDEPGVILLSGIEEVREIRVPMGPRAVKEIRVQEMRPAQFGRRSVQHGGLEGSIDKVLGQTQSRQGVRADGPRAVWEGAVLFCMKQVESVDFPPLPLAGIGPDENGVARGTKKKVGILTGALAMRRRLMSRARPSRTSRETALMRMAPMAEPACLHHIRRPSDHKEVCPAREVFTGGFMVRAGACLWPPVMQVPCNRFIISFPVSACWGFICRRQPIRSRS